jgi:hypothetical protein
MASTVRDKALARIHKTVEIYDTGMSPEMKVRIALEFGSFFSDDQSVAHFVYDALCTHRRACRDIAHSLKRAGAELVDATCPYMAQLYEV